MTHNGRLLRLRLWVSFRNLCCVENVRLTVTVITAALLAALFLRSVGIVGHNRVIRHVDSDQTMAAHAASHDTGIPMTN
jgi:hypothetical protein